MKCISHRYLVFCAVLILAFSVSPLASAQVRVELDEGRWVALGGAVRASFSTSETGPGTGSYSQNVSLESARLFFNAQVHSDFLVEMNTEYAGADSELRVLDAIVKYAPSEYFNIWLGRHLPPSDRANLDGPYYLSAYDYPGLVSRYPAIFAGRDNGVLFSGQAGGGVFKYAFGFYEGSETVAGGNNMLYASRIVVNLLDPESGFYNSSTYYGDKDVFAIGFAVQHQGDVVLVNGDPEAFTGYNFDLLYEQNLGDSGVVTLEGAFYDYDLGGAAGDGSAYLAQAAYLFPGMIGIGRVQPVIRYQDFLDESIVDAGANYVIRGHNARVSFIYSRAMVPGASSNGFKVGTQFQF